MGKKKFIDKKKSATFQLLARDSSDPSFSHSPGTDRVFVRVDSNAVPAAAFISAADECVEPHAADHDSRYDDAPDDDEVEERAFGSSMSTWSRGDCGGGGQAVALPEEVRKEILELGFPDDGYNYLIHLREIKNTGGGSAFYHNPKFRIDHIPRDVKAYDASRLRISEVDGEPAQNSIYNVASKTTNARVQKVVDPEVAALLDDSDLSRFGSDVEDLEEDFVVRANLHEDEEGGKADVCDGKNFSGEAMINRNQNNALVLQVSKHSRVTEDFGSMDGFTHGVIGEDCADEKPRARRLLDEQFDLLERHEYGTDDDDEVGDYLENYQPEEDESLAEKLKFSLDNNMMDDLELDDGKYKVPADLFRNKQAPEIEEEEVCAADVIRRCKEYAEGYEVEDGNEDKDVVLVQDSSDESEAWDCETIVSTYSTLDNHPGKIGAPKVTRKKKLAETMSAALSSSSPIICLRGKEKLPVDFLPGSRKPAAEKVREQSTMRTEQYKRKPHGHGQESKEDKKERKAAVKEERREARRIKKEMKGLYRGEAHRAQRVAAISGPSSIHLL